MLEYVYILRSLSDPARRYVGRTNDPQRRLIEHNSGNTTHTSKFRPWKIETLIGFDDNGKAVAFERYLKSGSGFAFASKHF